MVIKNTKHYLTNYDFFLGIKLKNNIVIIDEAHNLLEALGQMYSSCVTHSQLYYAHLQLLSYKAKYSTRFSYNNLLCINQLIFVVKKLLSTFGKSEGFVFFKHLIYFCR